MKWCWVNKRLKERWSWDFSCWLWRDGKMLRRFVCVMGLYKLLKIKCSYYDKMISNMRWCMKKGGGERGCVWSGLLKEDVNNGEEMKKRKGLKIWILVGWKKWSLVSDVWCEICWVLLCGNGMWWVFDDREWVDR